MYSLSNLVSILFIFSTIPHNDPGSNSSTREYTSVDTVSRRTYQSSFYLLTTDITKSKGLKVVGKEEYYFADSMPVIPVIYIDSTYKQFDKYSGRFELVFIFNRTGTRIWSDFTRRDTDKFTGLIIKNQLLNAARIQEQIEGGVTSLTGLYSENEAEELVSTISKEIIRVREEA